MKKLLLSIGNTGVTSEGACITKKEIEEAEKIVWLFDEDFTNKDVFITSKEFKEKEYDGKGKENLNIKGHLLKDLKLDDNKKYRLDKHNYLDLIIVSEYYENKM